MDSQPPHPNDTPVSLARKRRGLKLKGKKTNSTFSNKENHLNQLYLPSQQPPNYVVPIRTPLSQSIPNTLSVHTFITTS